MLSEVEGQRSLVEREKQKRQELMERGDGLYLYFLLSVSYCFVSVPGTYLDTPLSNLEFNKGVDRQYRINEAILGKSLPLRLLINS